jgi:hypothetical protein
MTHLLASELPQRIKQLNRKLNEKGYEIQKRRAYTIKPMKTRAIPLVTRP